MTSIHGFSIIAFHDDNVIFIYLEILIHLIHYKK